MQNAAIAVRSIMGLNLKKDNGKNGNVTNQQQQVVPVKGQKYNSKESHPKEMTMGKQAC